jgi:glycyl-tRNA synthetase beta chain
MDRELLLEIGCEELPAGWLPDLTSQIGDVLSAQLQERRLPPEAPVETFSTPRRLTVRIARVPERQADSEEIVTGPPVSAAFGPDGRPAPPAVGFAARHGVEVDALERVDTPKGVYLVCRKRQRGRAAVDVLPEALGSTLRALTFPKQMHWDAALDDGHGGLPFGRPIRWILFLYGGRVVPFTIARAAAAETVQVQEVTSGAVTYGHRFLATSGRAGRAIKVRSFDEYRTRLLEHFVILERSERHDKIARALDARARRLQGRVSRAARGESALLQEVPDLVEYPSVIAGTFALEFLELPREVLIATLVQHQHYFPVEGEDGALKNAFLAVINTDPDNERAIAANAERVVTARLRDARFFWEADRNVPLEVRLDRLATLQFHAKLGTYRDKAERIERLARWIAADVFGASAEVAAQAARAARLSKADLTTDMVRELTELQGVMGGIYARAEGEPEDVWKAIYYHYLPIGVEVDAPPAPSDLGKAAVTWAAVSLADKLDTIVGLYWAQEEPTGSRDPYGLRRCAQGIVKTLIDLPSIVGIEKNVSTGELVNEALKGFGGTLPAQGVEPWSLRLRSFLAERVNHALRTRGRAFDEVNAANASRFDANLESVVPLRSWRVATALAEARTMSQFVALAELFKRVKNISKGVDFNRTWPELKAYAANSVDEAEKTLVYLVADSAEHIRHAADRGDYLEALRRIAEFQPAVARYFDDVMVMVDDTALREKRLQVMAGVRDLVADIADISEIVA